MLKIIGSSALSSFEQRKLSHKLQKICPFITGITAKFIYFVDLKKPINLQKQSKLSALLEGDIHNNIDYKGYTIIIAPRIGTFSSWSSKATDIANNLGLK